MRHLGVLLFYLGLAVALTWPLATHPGSLVIGGYESRNFAFEDASQNIWNVWWVGHALIEGKNPFWSDMLYYPEGVQFYFQTLNLAGIVPVLPIHYAFGPVVAYSCAILLALTLTGYAGFLLARAFVPSMAVPLFAGALLTASPFHLMKLQGNHLNLLSMQWMVFYLLALIWLDQRRDQRSALLLALLALLVALTDWYWVFACALFTLAWLGFGLVRHAAPQAQLRAYGWFVFYTLMLTTPLLLGIWSVRESLQLNPVAGEQWWRGENEHFSADALGLFFPALWPFLAPEEHRSILQALTPHTPPQYGAEAWYVGAGWLMLSLAAVGVWYAGALRWRWLFVGGCMWLLSLGPTLTVAGFKLGIPMPYAILQELPLLSVARRPSHFAALCIVVLMIFAAIGLQQSLQKLNQPMRSILFTSLIALAMLELWPSSWIHYEFKTPTFLENIRQEPGAVADLPYEALWTSRALRHQIVHQQPILGGYVARRPAYPTLTHNPLLGQIGSLQAWKHDIIPFDATSLRAMQCYYRLRHVIVDRATMSTEELHSLRAILKTLTGMPLTPTYNDGSYIVYQLPLFATACRPFILLDPDWYELERDDAQVWRWTGAENRLWLVNPSEQPRTIRLQLAVDGQYESRSELWAGQELLARWDTLPARRDYTLVFIIPSGATQLTLRSSTHAEPDTSRQIGFPITALWVEE
ncbi:hypothetical protein CJ255_04675 [Candidatus Viridilinea mediisalina]|uniref:DUF6311 domain-containing protein n=2 Tax=Candidatus Viridilinea mediisalina TaxID=2024553 RepID=A0A2A6RMY8_9CHLR|nr:hypothetical protein CJ255_04675 [Candidatus Viridilinea mediisalina]